MPHPAACRVALSILFVLAISTGLVSPIHSQTRDDVHIVPNTPDDAPPRGIVDPTLRTRTRPLKIDVNLVLVPVTVVDEKNRPVMGLGKDDFALYEQDRQQAIQFFSSEDAPISIGVIVDLSGSMGNKIETERRALAEFSNHANPADDYFVITFASRPHIAADTTKSIADIQAKIGMAPPAGYTALLDAVYLGVQKLRSARYQRHALLIISDGGDNNSRYKLKEIKSLVQEADVQIYGIGLFDDNFPLLNMIDAKIGKHLLTQITEATGGRTIALRNATELPEAASTISRELRSQYILGYRPPVWPANRRPKDRWRKIKVRVAKVSGQASRQAYYKRGYLAPSETAHSLIPER